MTPKQLKAKRIKETKRIYRLLADIDAAHSEIDKLLYDGELGNDVHFGKFESDLDEIALDLSDLGTHFNHSADMLEDRNIMLRQKKS